jgi:NAD(P)-dependent dehydrogenase (short-subunit alcohol dehydrogenase family)
MTPIRFPQTAWLVPLLIAVLHLPVAAHAGGHVQKWPQQPDIKLDPEKRSDITGTVLVTGANRGIGLQLATNYAERGWKVIATARKPEKADDLNALAEKHSNLTVEYLDLLDHEGIDALAEKLQDVPIDVLFNNAAILGDPAGQDFGNLDYDLMQRVYAVNAVGTFKLAEAFFDHVVASEQKKIVAMTSQQGSIGALRDPLIPYYKMSKTAVNMGMSTIAKRVKKQKVTIALISPGAVDTKMMNDALDHAGFKGSGFLITPEQSAEAVINIVDQYDFELSGTFMSHRGDVIPW